MKTEQLSALYGAAPQVEQLAAWLENNSLRNVFLQGLVASAAPTVFAAAAPKTSKTILFILSDSDEAAYFYNDLCQLMGRTDVLLLPSVYRRAAKYGQRDPANEILATEVLTRLNSQQGSRLYLVSSPEALAELVASREKVAQKTLELSAGQIIDPVQVEETLLDFGFQQADYVYEPGQFAVRGSILDVFSYSCEYPFRIDFFDDEIDSIRTFDVQNQLSRDRRQNVQIVPELSPSSAGKASVFTYLPQDAVIACKDWSFVRSTIAGIYADGFLSQAIADRLNNLPEAERQEAMAQFRREAQLLSPSQLDIDTANFRRIDFGRSPSSSTENTIDFEFSAQPLFHKNFPLLCDTLADYIEKGYSLYILAENPKQHQRLRDIFEQQSLDQSSSTAASQPSPITFTAIEKTLHEGFIDHRQRLCIFTDHQIFDRYHKYSTRSDVARAGKMALSLKELHNLEVGDYLVHVDFGVGKFGGLVRIPTQKSYQEVIRIVYQRGDIVDVSIHSLYKISKYRGSQTGEPPRLSTLGTGAWERLKERTKTRIKDIARDLIRLYARQKKEQGFAFSPDSYLQHELEASFMFEDTPDQSRATLEVKADMESPRPMNRLVCGDVGFGKTEVAIRAAFKAACDSKQVAVLVPTTVLAFQHFQTFSERLKDLPVRVDYLTRARTQKQTKDLLADLEAGKIDILVGTHKLIGKQVKWKDLGLLIIDEEQKFGVAVKEKLRMIKSSVDTLTMSATPIPRTLQFSLMGARDMSIIRTAPPNRYPIQTELSTFSSELITDAINFEMSRNGQVFFVNNRINSLYEMAHLIQKHIPDCRVAVGHGQMATDELERILVGFINQDYDVLLSTTIVENGIDIPNANTIIINDAHKFGLSDLHQMRGRVGRSNRKAFCYLLAPPKNLLTPEARRRLEAMENFSELGSGFNVAMQDLDIRGAGNLLGAEQSGFMEELGYETYEKILKEAMAELRSESDFRDTRYEVRDTRAPLLDNISHTSHPRTSPPRWFVADCAVDSDLDMYFPDLYVPGSSERMLLYRELEHIETDRDLEAYRQRLTDRFGPIPPEGEELLQVVALRRIGRRLGCERIVLRQGRMTMQFVGNPQSPYYQSEAFGNILMYATNQYRRCQIKEVKGRRVMHVASVTSVSQAVNLLRAMEEGRI